MSSNVTPFRNVKHASMLWAAPERAEEIAALHAKLFDPPWDTNAIRGLLEHPAATSLIAVAGSPKSVIGFVIGQLAADEAEILSIGVSPNWQRAGVAVSAGDLAEVVHVCADSRGEQRLDGVPVGRRIERRLDGGEVAIVAADEERGGLREGARDGQRREHEEAQRGATRGTTTTRRHVADLAPAGGRLHREERKARGGADTRRNGAT